METDSQLTWLDNVKAPVVLTELKGVVKEIHEPREVKTKEYGTRKIIDIVVECREGRVIATEFLPHQFPLLTNTANLGKILKKYECSSLKELLGKEVELTEGKKEGYVIRKE